MVLSIIRVYSVKIYNFICDAPARAFIKCIKIHTGYASCEKCTEYGKYANKLFLKIVMPKKEQMNPFFYS